MKAHRFGKEIQHQSPGPVGGRAAPPLPPVATDDDGSWYDAFKAIEKERQAERAQRREDAPRLLAEAGITFESKNLGAHLIVKALGKTIDFWPGTSLWVMRGSSKKIHGVEHLIARSLALIETDPPVLR